MDEAPLNGPAVLDEWERIARIHGMLGALGEQRLLWLTCTREMVGEALDADR